MSKVTIDQLAGMMQDEFLKVHERFVVADKKIDNLATSTKERFSIADEKIDNLATDTKESFFIADKKIDNLTSTVEWIATELKTLKQELIFNQAAHDRYESRIVALEKDIALVREQLKK